MGKLISLIYFYIISAVSIGLLIYAAFSWGTLLLNLTQYDNYPLRYGLENCDDRYPYFKGGPVPAIDSAAAPASLSAQEREQLKQQCITQTEFERKQHKLDDIKNSGISTLVGIVLFALHFPTARRLSKEK
jgi:hypothetical protein